MISNITEMASHASHILKLSPVGSVHSVYRKTINLNMGTHLVSLQAASSPMSPISLITDLNAEEMADAAVHTGDPVTVHGHTLTVLSGESTVTFSLDQTDVFDSFLHDSPVTLSLTAVRDAIRLSDSGGLSELLSGKQRKPSSDFGKEAFLSIARDRMEEARALISCSRYDEACGTLVRMLGLGIGLTPSGDDFLCGILAGLLFCGKWNHPFSIRLRQQLSCRLGDTNDISRAFLSSALERHFSRPVIELPDSKDVSSVLSAFSGIGHSSGMDSLCGIYFISSLFA